MTKTLNYLSCAGLLAFALPTQAASVITANNSFVEGYLYAEDNNGNSVTEGGGLSANIYDPEFWDSQGGMFDGYSFPYQYDSFGNPIINASSGLAGGDQHSIYDTDHFYGTGFAVAEVSDPNNELSFIQVSGESLVDITFDVTTAHTYTLTGNLFAESLGRVNVFFDGNEATESDGAFSFSGYLDAGSYTLTIDAIAAIDASQRATSRFDYDLQLTAVPLPAAVWLFGSGLIGLIGIAKRKIRT